MRYLIKSAFRRKGNYWIAAAAELLGASFRRWHPMPVSAAERARWRRGLLIGADHIGDVLYGTSSIPALARATPDCAWFHAVRKPADQILETNPHLAGLLFLPPDQTLRQRIEIYRLMRDGHFDVVICYNSFDYIHYLLTATLVGIPTRIGYVHKGFSFLATHPLQIRYPSSYARYFQAMVSQVTGEEQAGELRPLIYPTQEDERSARELFEARGLHQAKAVLACSVFTRMTSGVISPRHFIETLRLVERENDVRLVFLGAAAEKPRLEQLLRESGLKGEIVAGDLGLRAVSCFLRHCHAAFTTDSGVRHMANAAGIPVVYPRNLFADRVETGNYCSSEIDVAPDVERLSFEERREEVLSFDHALAAAQLRRVLTSEAVRQ